MTINTNPQYTAGRNLTPEQLNQLLNLRGAQWGAGGERQQWAMPGKMGAVVTYEPNMSDPNGYGDGGGNPTYDGTGGHTYIYQPRNVSTWGGSDVADVWDETGKYVGTSSGATDLRGLANWAASSIGAYYGATALNGAGAGATAGGSSGGLTAAQQAAMMAANGMTDAEIAAAMGTAGSNAAGLTGVTGGVAAAGTGAATGTAAGTGTATGAGTTAGTTGATTTGGASTAAGKGAMDLSFSDWLNLAKTGYGLYSNSKAAGAQQDAANSATQAQQDAANKQLALQYEMWKTQQENQKPWLTAGQNAVGRMSTGLQPGGEFTKKFGMDDFTADPGYQWRLSQGMKNLQGQAAATGSLMSGRTLKALNDYASNQATQTYQDAYNRWMNDQNTQFNRLASVSGLGQTASGQLNTNAGTNAYLGSNTYGTLGNNLGNIAIGNGNAQAGAIINNSNLLTNAFNSWMKSNAQNGGGKSNGSLYRSDDPYRDRNYVGGSEGE